MFLSSCYQNSFSVKKIDELPPREHYTYESLAAASQYWDDYDKDTADCSEGEKILYRATKLLRKRKYKEADELLTTILNDTNKTVALLANEYKNNVCFQRLNKIPKVDIINEQEYPISIKYNRVFTEVTIQGEKYNFLVDNGYTNSSISSKHIPKLKYSAVADDVRTLDAVGNVRENSYSYIISDVNIANIRVDSVYFSPGLSDYDGVIGMDILSQLDVHIDFDRKKIIFKESDPADADTNNFYFWAMLPLLFATECDGAQTLFVLDLGSEMSFIFDRFFLYHSTPRKVVDQINRSASGVLGSKSFKLDILGDLCFNIGDYSFHFDKIINMPPIEAMELYPTVGFLGADLWQNGRIRLDFKNGIFKYEED